MSNVEEQRAAMLHAIGDCITAWSNVETDLATIFRFSAGTGPIIADSLLATPRAFEVRSLMVHRVLQIRLTNPAELDDWNLLYNHICRMNGKRNEVAHAAMLSVEGKTIVLEPYFVMTNPKPHLSIEDVKARASDFHDLHRCLFWFFNNVLVPPSVPRPAFAISTPGLLLRLREEEVARRREQREQQKP
jgi:hypothetical protein